MDREAWRAAVHGVGHGWVAELNWTESVLNNGKSFLFSRITLEFLLFMETFMHINIFKELWSDISLYMTTAFWSVHTSNPAPIHSFLLASPALLHATWTSSGEWVQQLECVGLVASQHTGSYFPDQELNLHPRIGRRILSHRTTREVSLHPFKRCHASITCYLGPHPSLCNGILALPLHVRFLSSLLRYLPNYKPQLLAAHFSTLLTSGYYNFWQVSLFVKLIIWKQNNDCYFKVEKK